MELIMDKKKDLSLLDRIKMFMEGKEFGVATLKEIYNNVKEQFETENITEPNNFKEKIRCVIYRSNQMKRVTKGAYLYLGKNSSGLIIHGDGRKLKEIEDESIDTIITDHPWEDKKAHKSGNQKNFAADYEGACFRYEEEDFIQKARVLKDGGYLVEFIPTESFSNYEYLYEIKQMARKAGFEYYAKLMWMKNPEGSINTGRSTKGTEDILIFTKGKPRRLAAPKKPYLTKFILPGRVDIPAPKPKEKRHQAEKPVSLYEMLIEATTEEGDVTLDQFGGSLNIIEAAVKKNRFAVAYEYLSKILSKSINRLKAIPLFASEEDIKSIEAFKEEDSIEYEQLLCHTPENNVVIMDIVEDVEVEKESVQGNLLKDEIEYSKEEQVLMIENNRISRAVTIPREVSEFQKGLLDKLVRFKPEFFNTEEKENLKIANIANEEQAYKINLIFNKIYSNIYENHYKRLNVNMAENEKAIFNSVSKEIKNSFEEKIENEFIRSYYNGYLIEAEDFAKYMIKKCGAKSFEDIQEYGLEHIDNYMNLVKNHSTFKGKNTVSVKTMILKLLV